MILRLVKKYKKRFLINNLNRVSAEREGYNVGVGFNKKTKQGNVKRVAYAYETYKSRGRDYKFQKLKYAEKKYKKRKKN